MASIGKKILSAFVELPNDPKPVAAKQAAPEPRAVVTAEEHYHPPDSHSKFEEYFDKLFMEANIQGPDYFEFSKMADAMSSIPDEKTRYAAVFAGLRVQGLDKQKLLSTAASYLQVLDSDAGNFNSTVDAALKEKVHAKQKEIEEKAKRIGQLTEEINRLHNEITLLDKEVKENEEKIENNAGGYKAALDHRKSRILLDIEKIKQHVH